MLASHIIEVSCHDIEKASELTGLAASSQIEKEDSELLGYGHGYSGLPGKHRSTGVYGNEKYDPNSLKTARLMLKQDEENLKEIRRRLEWGYGRTFKGGVRKFKRWHLQHPPISRTPLCDPNRKKSWKEKLGHKKR